MFRTTPEAKRAAHATLLRQQQTQGRVVSPWVRNAVLRQLPAKDLTR